MKAGNRKTSFQTVVLLSAWGSAWQPVGFLCCELWEHETAMTKATEAPACARVLGIPFSISKG